MFFKKIRSILGLTSHGLALSKRKQKELEFKTIGKCKLRKIWGKEAAVNVSQVPCCSSTSSSLDPAGNKNFENKNLARMFLFL